MSGPRFTLILTLIISALAFLAVGKPQDSQEESDSSEEIESAPDTHPAKRSHNHHNKEGHDHHGQHYTISKSESADTDESVERLTRKKTKHTHSSDSSDSSASESPEYYKSALLDRFNLNPLRPFVSAGEGISVDNLEQTGRVNYLLPRQHGRVSEDEYPKQRGRVSHDEYSRQRGRASHNEYSRKRGRISQNEHPRQRGRVSQDKYGYHRKRGRVSQDEYPRQRSSASDEEYVPRRRGKKLDGHHKHRSRGKAQNDADAQSGSHELVFAYQPNLKLSSDGDLTYDMAVDLPSMPDFKGVRPPSDFSFDSSSTDSDSDSSERKDSRYSRFPADTSAEEFSSKGRRIGKIPSEFLEALMSLQTNDGHVSLLGKREIPVEQQQVNVEEKLYAEAEPKSEYFSETKREFFSAEENLQNFNEKSDESTARS